MGLTRPRAHQLQETSFKFACRAISTSNVTLSGGAPATVDGVSVTQGDRVLVIGQTDKSQNGIYNVATVGTGSNGTWNRTKDADDANDITAGTQVSVTEGTTYGDTVWKLTTDGTITIGTTDQDWEQASAYGFGTVTVDGTSLVADQVGDTLTITAGNNISLSGNATSDTYSISVSDSPTFTGNITGGNLTTAGLVSAAKLTVDTNTLHVDSVNNRVGIGTASPAYQVEIENTGTNALLVLDRTDGAACFIEGQATRSAFGSVGATPLVLAYNSLAVIEIGAGGAITVNPDGGSPFTFPTADGSANQILATDGAGNVDWTSTPTFGTVVTGNVIPSANVTYDLGNATNRFNDIYLSGNTINLGTITIKDDGGTMGVFASDGTTPASLGNTSTVVASGNISGGNVISSGAIHTGNNGVVRFHDSDGSNYVEFRSQSTVASNLQFKWPAADGTSGQVLQTDGAGTLSFATASGGGGASGFQSSTITTHPAASGNEDLATGPNDDTVETPFESGAQDAFGVSLGTVYDQMEPIGSTTTVDLGDSEAYVGA